MIIQEITDKQDKKQIAASILEALPNWFGIQEARQRYISESGNLPFFAAIDQSRPVGFLVMEETSQYATEIYVMGVLPDRHNQGIGTSLLNTVMQWAKEKGYEFLLVKTLDESHPDIYYAKTRKFYASVGFKPLVCLPELWGKENPCLIMIQHIV